MNIAALVVDRPVLTMVVSMLIVLLGAISIPGLPVREYPAVDPPTLAITTSYPGAAAEVVQAQITEPIEEAVNTVAGVRTLTSTSREGVSQVNAEFTLGTDLDTAASDVRDQLARAVRFLPADVNSPVLNKAHADSTSIFALTVRSAHRSPLELSAFADSLRERLQTVPGIAGVDQPAEKRYAMRLWLDPHLLAAHVLSPLDVRDALLAENIELPSGRIEGESVELPIKTMTRLRTAEEFNALIVKRTSQGAVRLRDLGHAELAAQNERAALEVNGESVAGLYFKPQPGANHVDIIDELMRRVASIRTDLPDDISVDVAFDNTQFVRRSLHEVTETVAIAFVLVVAVVFAFLRSWRTTLIPVIAIPISIVGTFAIIAAAGYSINTLTLLGIVLAIGLVVDDAIVVLENIHRRIESGERPREAAINGTREIFAAVVSTTLVLAIVFLPLLFMGGMSGQLFREFGVTIAGAVILSAVVALTLTPMMSSRMLSGADKHSAFYSLTERWFEQLENNYGLLLTRILKRPVAALGALVFSGAMIALMLATLPRELAPVEDRGRIWIRATAPESVGYEYMRDFMSELAQAAAERVPEARMVLMQAPGVSGSAGVQGAINTGAIRLFLSERDQRQRSQSQIAEELRSLQAQFPAAHINITQEPTIGERRSNQSGLQFVIQAPDVESLREVLPEMLQKVRASPVFAFVDSDLKFDKQEVRLEIDRDKAHALGISARDIAQTLQTAFAGQRFGYFVDGGKQYEVLAQFTRDFRSSPQNLGAIGLRGDNDERLTPLDNLVTLSEATAPAELYRHNRYVSATLTATLARGGTMGEGIATLQALTEGTLDERFHTTLTGAASEFVDSASSLSAVLLVALLLVYLTLSAQFESFLDPLVILLTVPLAVAGALSALWCFGQSLNVFSQIGLIMLIGLVTKNGILIVEFANQRLLAGAADASSAVLEAARMRMRPIMMTTLATAFGLLPIALALGAGAESRKCMGIAVIGGLLFGSVLTLGVIPAMYALLKRPILVAHVAAPLLPAPSADR